MSFSSGSGPIFVSRLQCQQGAEFSECVVENDLGQTDCSHSDDVGVRCEGMRSTKNNDL